MPMDILLNPTNLRRLTIALVLVVCFAAGVRDQGFPSPAAGLITKVVANELADRAQQRKWMYLIDKRDGKQTLTEEQVDTKDGSLFVSLQLTAHPLTRTSGSRTTRAWIAFYTIRASS